MEQMTKTQDLEEVKERRRLAECRSQIQENIRLYQEKTKQGKRETEELFQQVRAGAVELYSQLMVSMDVQEHNERTLHQNESAYPKPYFGRVDYEEISDGKTESIYIGKHGIFKDRTDIEVVDWRAPVSTLYYENELGRGNYSGPDETIEVDLHLKRTYDIDDGNLIGFYDSDIASNDELLVKYLAKNKEVVLGDIIATIQKEQNEIIREKPFTDIVVQGVAGSGKTTVAMHRISYILYNYEKRFAPEEFCIIGSNDMLLNYITSGLPELDVYHIHQKRMDQFLRDLLENDWKKRNKIIDVQPDGAWKSQLQFVRALEMYLAEIKEASVGVREVRDEKAGVLLSEESVRRVLIENPDASITKLAKLLNERLLGRMKMLSWPGKAESYKAKREEYKKFFQLSIGKKNIFDIYIRFLEAYERFMGEKYVDTEQLEKTIANVQKHRFDVYDLAALALIRHRVTAKDLNDEFGQIIIDEAQDFGVMVYYVLKQVLRKTYFTIMGDVSQNIHFDMGMNGWDELTEEVLTDRKKFHILAKSYRNTIEISQFAGRILEKASAGRYKIQPVIRHGREVGFRKIEDWENCKYKETADLIKDIQKRGFDSTVVICRTEEEADKVRIGLSEYIPLEDTEGMHFEKGVMVLPIALTKGLEFDTVVLFNPSPEQYPMTEGDAKLLYVAVTRALHELHIVYDELSEVISSICKKRPGQ